MTMKQRTNTVKSQMLECEKLIDEKRVSLEKWKDALHKMKESGVVLGKNKANETKKCGMCKKSSKGNVVQLLFKEKSAKAIERLVDELNYGIEGMVYRLGFAKR